MPKRFAAFLRTWMLPIAMTTGAAVYLILHALPGVPEQPYLDFCARLQPILIGTMLFLQLNLLSPADLRLHRWHLWLLLIQASLFAVFGVMALRTDGAARILLEAAMLCLICPTAAAAGVITVKLGGDLAGIMTYTVLANALASLLIPLMVPLVHPVAGLGFAALVWAIVRRVFSILVLPCLLAWLIRYLFPSLQRALSRLAGLAFPLWGICLTLSISLATASLIHSGLGAWVLLGIAAVSLICCLLQFALGHRIGRRYDLVSRVDGGGLRRGSCGGLDFGIADGSSRYPRLRLAIGGSADEHVGPRQRLASEITAGQALGQKNTGFIIWLGLTYLTPVTSVAGGLYAIWHNLVNSWELAHSYQN